MCPMTSRGERAASRLAWAQFARVLAETLQVDLDSLRGDLLGVAHETVRPSHASLWLRERA